jgi:hypothetical protein
VSWRAGLDRVPYGEVLAIALARFRTHPLQTWLTLTGLFVGTASIILVVALGLTGRGYVMTQIEGVGSHLIWVTYRDTVSAGVARQEGDQIRDTDVRAVEARRDLFRGVTPLVTLHGQVAVLARSANLTVLGTSANYPAVRKNLRLLRGRFIDQDDVDEQAKVCVVNRHLYEELFGDAGLAGKTVRTLGLSFWGKATSPPSPSSSPSRPPGSSPRPTTSTRCSSSRATSTAWSRTRKISKACCASATTPARNTTCRAWRRCCGWPTPFPGAWSWCSSWWRRSRWWSAAWGS